MSHQPVAMRSEPDVDPDETREWLDSFDSVLYRHDPQRALFLLDRLKEHARQRGLVGAGTSYSAYRNTIPLEREAPYPGDLQIETRLTAIMRWNALAMVVRANRAYGELGGHIASYASAAEIFEVGFNHFFAGASADHGGDLVYYQPPGPRRAPHPAVARGRVAKGARPSLSWITSGRRCRGTACAPIRIPG